MTALQRREINNLPTKIVAHAEYKSRHDRIGQYLHCVRIKDSKPAQKWYAQHPETETGGENVTNYLNSLGMYRPELVNQILLGQAKTITPFY